MCVADKQKKRKMYTGEEMVKSRAAPDVAVVVVEKERRFRHRKKGFPGTCHQSNLIHHTFVTKQLYGSFLQYYNILNGEINWL